MPTLGIHHHNRYNPFCLADDIMEPFRPYVDVIVWQMIQDHELINELTPALKKELLQIPMIDVWIDGHKSLLMNAATTTANSLWQCFTGEQRRIRYPEPEKFPL